MSDCRFKHPGEIVCERKADFVTGSVGARDCRFNGREWRREIADLVGGVGERDCRSSGREWGRDVADLIGGGVGKRLLIYWRE